MYKNQWQESYNQLLAGAAIIGFFCAWGFGAFVTKYNDDAPLCTGVGAFAVWGVVAWVAFKKAGYFNQTAISKFFLVDESTARQVVANVLSSKTWPFEQTEKGFQLDTVTIRISAGVLGGGWSGSGRFKGTLVAIGPNRGHNRLLIDSLIEKIDEAFLPRGVDTSS